MTVKLQPGLKWSDGTPLTASDVAWTFNYYVDNADVLANMALGAAGIEHTVAVDPTTVRIECSRPKADLLYSYLPVLPEHIWKYGDSGEGRLQLPQQAAARRQRPVPHRGVEVRAPT